MIEKIDIINTGVVDSVRNKMEVATAANKGLLAAGVLGTQKAQSSVLLFESNSIPITGSMLLSVSATTSGFSNLYFIRISRASGGTGNPALRVKVLAGIYEIKIKAKTDNNGVCRIYAERLQYTPVLDVLTMNMVGVTLKMETADNSAFEGGFEAVLE